MEKFKQWIVSHKLWSIVIVSALVVCVALAIALPLALSHKHTYSEEWSKNAESHWHACLGEGCDGAKDNAEHTSVNKNNATQYWLECSVCGYQQEKINATVDMDAGVISNAVQFKDAEGNDYTNWEAEKFNHISNKVDTKVKFIGNGYYRYREVGLSSESLEGMYLNFNNDGVKTYAGYERNSVEDMWFKYSGSGNYENLDTIAKNLVGISSLSALEFGYNEEDNTYGSSLMSVSYAINYTLKFANGKLVSVYVKKANPSSVTLEEYSWTISYANTTIEAPNDSEVIETTRLPYITSQGKFSLSNVDLNAGEPTWFMINITSTMFTGNTTDIQVMFTAEGDATLPTLTFVAVNARGTEISDDSGTNGTGYFEGLGTGNCYIKITATENCTGSLSIVFG